MLDVRAFRMFGLGWAASEEGLQGARANTYTADTRTRVTMHSPFFAGI